MNSEQIKEYLSLFGYSGFGSGPSKSNIFQCPTCTQLTLYIFEGMLLCRHCKTDYGQIVDTNTEWRSYHNNQNRCGQEINQLLIESSYGTTIGSLWKFHGISKKHYQRMKQLNSWHSMPYHERSLKQVFDWITLCGQNWGLTENITSLAHQLYTDLYQKQSQSLNHKLARGDNREGIIAACISYACKEYGVARQPIEIARICQIDVSDVTRGIKVFYQLMKNSQVIDFQHQVGKYITKFSDLVKRYCRNLGINGYYRSKISLLTNRIHQLKILTRNTPQTMVCTCIFFSSVMFDLGLSKEKIAQRCHISAPTISKSYKKLVPFTATIIDILFDKAVLEDEDESEVHDALHMYLD